MAKKYKPRPIIIEAVQWTGKNINELKEFCGDQVCGWNRAHFSNQLLSINLSGSDTVNYIVKGDYICKQYMDHITFITQNEFETLYQEA